MMNIDVKGKKHWVAALIYLAVAAILVFVGTRQYLYNGIFIYILALIWVVLAIREVVLRIKEIGSDNK